MGIQTSLEADVQLAKAGQPRMGTLDNPARPTQLLAAFYATSGNARQDAAACEMLTATTEVITFVGV